jgi:hypothetical protein
VLQVLKKFRLEPNLDGEDVLLRSVTRDNALRWVKVVALEELPTLLEEHHRKALAFKCSRKLYDHVSRASVGAGIEVDLLSVHLVRPDSQLSP